ncbi:DapH/DapD/GlmU-related protein [Pontibacter silvestris]|uniref:DapH/DapD/GlmU-related protein n=1 Tax=Pontibacter silvestris TaxID=2305183 RepID=A0ABW4WWJ7_9BACT|nr:DapH/DapD/GlmU-related protein [Pontibacter silvestris]MCC9137617.1 LpxA family transferase [Pontibacter silvestris]
MIVIDNFIKGFSQIFPGQTALQPWDITNSLKEILNKTISSLSEDYNINDGIAVHKTAIVEEGVIMKRPVIVSKNCYVGAHAYFREGVYLDSAVKIGPGCEIKSSVICSETAVAHFNYIGNSIIGKNINFEAGSIAANHYNERASKEISVLYESKIIETGTEKFGSLVGDNSRIGANAVLSPGTILEKNSIVKRLELIEQHKVK